MEKSLQEFLDTTLLKNPQSYVQNLYKTVHSKNITVEDWNAFVRQLESLISQSSEVYAGFNSVLNTIKNLNITNPMPEVVIDLPLEKGTGKDSLQQKSNIASKENSTALGTGTQANAQASFTSGIGTIANGKGQSVVGSYNSPKHDAMFIVGNGENSKSKSNAFEVFFDGRVNFDKSDFAKVSTGEVSRVLTNEGDTQVSKIVLAVGFVPNIVFIRCKDVAKGFTTTWINGYDSEGNAIPIRDNAITFTIPTDKGTEFTYVAMAVDSKQGTPPETPPSGGEPEIPENPDNPDEPEEPDTPNDSTTVNFTIDGSPPYTVDKGTKWNQWVNTTYDEEYGMYQYAVSGNYIYEAIEYDVNLEMVYVRDADGNNVLADKAIEKGDYYCLKDSSMITYILDGKQYDNCPKGKTWRYLTDKGLIPARYNWQDANNRTEQELIDSGEPYTDADLLLWTNSDDWIVSINDIGEPVDVHPNSVVCDGTEYGRYNVILYPSVTLNFILSGTDYIMNRTFDYWTMFLYTIEYMFDKVGDSIENRNGYLYVRDVGYFYYFKYNGDLEYLDYDTATDFYVGDLPLYKRTLYYSLEKSGLFKFDGRSYTYDLTSPMRWKPWLAEKFPNYEIVTESPLYIKDKGVVYYDYYGDGSYDDDGNYLEPGQTYSHPVKAAEFIGEHTYYFNKNYVVFTVEIDGVTKTYARWDSSFNTWVEWAISEGYNIYSVSQPFEMDIGWIDVYGGGRISPGHYVVMPRQDYVVYIDDNPVIVYNMTNWRDLYEVYGFEPLGYIEFTREGYLTRPPYDINSFYLCEDNTPVLASTYPLPNRQYYFKILFKVNDKQYAISKETTWAEYVAEDSSEFKIVNGLVYHKTTDKLLYYGVNEPARGWENIAGNYFFNDPKYITFYVDSASYTVVQNELWYNWITYGEGKNYFEIYDGYARHKETSKYVLDSTGSRVFCEIYADYIIANEYYVLESTSIPISTFYIKPYNQTAAKSWTVGKDTKWYQWAELEKYKVVGQYISIDDGKTLVAYSDGTRVTENSVIEETDKPYICVPAVKFKIVPLGFDYENEDTYDDEENIIEDNVLGGTTWEQWADGEGYMPLQDGYVSLDGGQSCIINSSGNEPILDGTTYRCRVIQAPWD